mgnify:CR=1 FL=1
MAAGEGGKGQEGVPTPVSNPSSYEELHRNLEEFINYIDTVVSRLDSDLASVVIYVARTLRAIAAHYRTYEAYKSMRYIAEVGPTFILFDRVLPETRYFAMLVKAYRDNRPSIEDALCALAFISAGGKQCSEAQAKEHMWLLANGPLLTPSREIPDEIRDNLVSAVVSLALAERTYEAVRSALQYVETALAMINTNEIPYNEKEKAEKELDDVSDMVTSIAVYVMLAADLVLQLRRPLVQLALIYRLPPKIISQLIVETEEE